MNPKVGYGLNFITVNQYSVVTIQDINNRSQWVVAGGYASYVLFSLPVVKVKLL